MKRFTLMLLFLAFAAFSYAQEADSVTLTLNVDLKPFIESQYNSTDFDAENDSVYVSGNILQPASDNNWSQPGTYMDAMMTDEDNDSIYTWSVKLPADSSYQYKYFYVPAGDGSSWSYGDWDGDPNRSVMVGANDTIVNQLFGGVLTAMKVVDMKEQTPIENASVTLAGVAMTTDAQGMVSKNLLHDSTYAYSVSAEGGYQNISDSVQVHREKDTLMIEMMKNMVTFKVDMSDTIANGSDFNYGEDKVYVAGSMVGWSEPGTNEDARMTDPDQDSVFTVTLPVSPGSIQYKYFYVPDGTASSWDYGEWQAGSDRTATIPNQSITLADTWGYMGQMVTFNVVNANQEAVEGAEVFAGMNANTTNSDGVASFNLVDGDYNYTVRKGGFVDSTGSFTIAGADTTIDVTMAEGPWVTFNVDMSYFADTSSEYTYGQDVYMSGDMAGFPQPGTNPAMKMHDMDQDSIYTLSMGLNPGSYEFKYFFLPDTLASSWNFGEWDGFDNRTMELGENDTTLNHVWNSWMVTFHVSDAAGAVEGATINMTDTSLTTDADGMASVWLTTGDYDYTVAMDGYLDASGTVTVEYSNVTQEVTLMQYYTVTFSVTDGSDPIEGASISVGDSSRTTDASGEATIMLVNGDYNYTVTADDFQDASGSFTVDGADMTVDVALTATAINNPLAEQLRVYPNPSEGNVTLSGGNVKGAQVTILNSIGEQLKQLQLNGNTNYLNLNKLNSGIYFIKIEKDQNTLVRKILIK